ncbi:tetratricopeptide repeat protein 19, mitochondrial-like [Gigantopelta aegis]|uniref:tetratricopeptide repeat protein 19, mitochondrial-like n=1 Tax=Gigantopelta aegis TaxID=1735272 RepID=UPI001B88810A|nr:tetratricopeptide repeat protein 19, mitochondrial-like [Gigantopelta aegis]
MGASRALLGFSKKEKEDPVTTLFREARTAQIQKNYDVAEKLFHDCLNVVNDQKKENKIDESEYLHAKSNIYDSMADMALSRGHFSDAEVLYKETMKCCLQMGKSQDDNALIEMSVKLASIYAMMKRDKEAVQGFKFCIDAQEKKVKENADSSEDTVALLGLALESYGRYLMYNKKLEEAQPLFERALQIAKKTLGEDHVQTLILRNDLATLDILNKNYVQAESNLREAIKIGERVDSPETPVLYINLGAIFLRKADSDNAHNVCSHALVVAKKIGNIMAISQAKRCLEKSKQLRLRKENNVATG